MFFAVEETLLPHLILLSFIFSGHLVKEDAIVKTFLPRLSVFGMDSNLFVRKGTECFWDG